MNAMWRARALPLVAVACALISLSQGLQEPINDDDVLHLHSIWLTAHGYIPYREFYEVHFPGLWILASPWAWVVSSGSALFLSARVLIALLFGVTIWLAGQIVRARGIQALFLGLLGIWVLQKCRVYYFRAEYIACFLLFLHLWMLTKMEVNGGRGGHSFWAAVFISLACSMTVRPMVFLIVQPVLTLRLRRQLNLPRHVGLWSLGLFAGALPTLIFFSIHHLWSDAWFWCIRFVSMKEVVGWKFNIRWFEMGAVLFGIAGVAVFRYGETVRPGTKTILTTSWLVGVAFFLVNPVRLYYESIHFYVVTASIAALVPSVVTARVAALFRRKQELWRTTLLLLMFVTAAVAIPFNSNLRFHFNREMQRRHVELIDWLQDVSLGEPVVLIGPNHPITEPDATDLRDPWPYARWIHLVYLRQRLRDFASSVLHRKPPVICVDPWMKYTGGRDILQWLTYNQVLSSAQVEDMQGMIGSRYLKVTFPMLSPEKSNLPFGHIFWVRKDRLKEDRIPQPHTISSPLFPAQEPKI